MRVTTRLRSIPASIIFACALVGQAAEFPFFEPVQPPRPFQIMVHRGEARQAPENTRPALDRCIEDGFEWAEVDVRLTRDGQHILSHNATVSDVDGRSWEISRQDWATLREVDTGSSFATRFAGEPLLSLRECLALCKGKLNLCLDCKNVNPEQLAREILAAGMEDQVVVYASLKDLGEMRKTAEGRIAGMAKWRPSLGGAEWAETNGLAAVEIDAPELTPSVVRWFHRAGIKVEAKVLGSWDQPAMWDRVTAAGADWVQTDLPEEVLAQALWRRLPQRPVMISLHRGANRYAPENTLPAFAKAIRLGADYVEFDVRTTSDGKFYLLHNSTLDGRTDGSGAIAQTPSAVIETLSAGAKFGRPFAQVGLPTLDEFLTAVDGKVNLYFDAKAITPEALAEAVDRHHMAERTVVYQSVPYLLRLKAIDPRIRALPPLGSPGAIDKIAPTLKPYAFDTRWEILSKELIARCHELGILVYSDALGDHERIEDYLQAIDWGIDLIQTDYPLRVMRALELWQNSQ